MLILYTDSLPAFLDELGDFRLLDDLDPIRDALRQILELPSFSMQIYRLNHYAPSP